ncbi:LytTR family DNA-binding domain-containing protein [Pseudomonas citronellolis]|uniref:LytTR family DNA-binding domain-containing protein n=1 Tax=Pseudomonas citronellolis TaxID=53408 RepID=UPI002649D8F7|nr:LytTR family DNA-binding domain-containing protein [Pseudomonas citronellolis]MDN6876902.1 LytTR family DNA-binding domain-containing protein [Pseudomonas citronellolis]
MRTIITAQLFGKKLSVPFSEITHFTSGDKYVSAHYPGGELILDEALKRIEDEFSEYLTRTHRSALVKTHLIVHLVRHIASKRGEVQLEGVSELIPVSETCLRRVTDVIEARRPIAA